MGENEVIKLDQSHEKFGKCSEGHIGKPSKVDVFNVGTHPNLFSVVFSLQHDFKLAINTVDSATRSRRFQDENICFSRFVVRDNNT